MNRLLLAICNSLYWSAVARNLLLVGCGTNLIGQPAASQPAAWLFQQIQALLYRLSTSQIAKLGQTASLFVGKGGGLPPSPNVESHETRKPCSVSNCVSNSCSCYVLSSWSALIRCSGSCESIQHANFKKNIRATKPTNP